jgi:putative transcriptional regulator
VQTEADVVTVRRKRTKTAGRRGARRDIGVEVIAGLEEAIAFEAGEDVGAVFKAAPINAGQAIVTPAPEFSANQIVALRKRMGLSQTVFALALNVSPETEKAWEQGKFAPSGSVKRLLQIASRRPATLLEGIVHLRSAPVAKPRNVRSRRQRS